MKRMHIHLSVESIDKSVAFYTKLFGAEPTVVKNDYTKWMLDDPRVNFAMSSHEGAKRGIEHVGIQAKDSDELAEVYGRIADAGGAIFNEGSTTCCYAQSEKNWTADPDGLAWEAFLTHGDVTDYGNRVDLDQLASNNATYGPAVHRSFLKACPQSQAPRKLKMRRVAGDGTARQNL